MKTQAVPGRLPSTVPDLLPRTSYPRNARALRSWFGFSQEVFAEILGAGRRTVARWERDHAAPESESSEGRLLFALAQVKDLILILYGDPAEGRRWLRTPLPVFRGKRPVDILRAKGPIPVLDVLKADLFGAYT